MKNQQKSKINLSIVIPALNEEKRLGSTLRALKSFLAKDPILKNLSIEVLVVAADAVDKTHEVALKEGKKFTHFKLLKPGPKLGKGRDVRFGMLEAVGEFVLFMDADLATPLRHISRFYKKAAATRSETDVFIATRNLKKHHEKPLRRLLSNTGNILYRVLGGVWIEDSQCGFKLFAREANKTCFTRQTIVGWGFDMEVLAIAKQHGYKIHPLRVNDWRHVPDGPFERGDVGKMASNTVQSLRDLFIIFGHRVRKDYTK